MLIVGDKFLMTYFLLLGNKKPDAAWTLMGIIVKVAQSVSVIFSLYRQIILDKYLDWSPYVISN